MYFSIIIRVRIISILREKGDKVNGILHMKLSDSWEGKGYYYLLDAHMYITHGDNHQIKCKKIYS